MKALQVSTNELTGGAGRAANRLHQGLLAAGVDSLLFVQARASGNERVLSAQSKLERALFAVRPTLDDFPLYLFSPVGLNQFVPAWVPDTLRRQVRVSQPDLLHLHWTAKGFIRIETLGRIRQPLVWTLHDMWPLTGGCFHSGDCRKYQSECGACPKLNSRWEHDLSNWVWWRKKRAWRKQEISLVCPSRWIAQRAAQSALFACATPHIIPNGLDLNRYSPLDRTLARSRLGLDPAKTYLLFSAIRAARNPYKGFDTLPEIFALLANAGWADQIELLILGEVSLEDVANIPAPVHLLGTYTDDVALALVYSAADLFLAPSLIDNFPNTVMESLACATPVVAFQVGGIPEMIESSYDGWLAESGDVRGFAFGVDTILRNRGHLEKMGEMARQSAIQKFDLARQTQQIIDLYQGLLAERQLFRDE